MKTIAFLSQKGGSGKTTMAVHAAVAAQQTKERVVLVDTDPQKSATVWSTSREAETPVVATASASDLSRVLEAAKAERMTLAIVDTAPHSAPDAARVAGLSDLIVIPCRPTAFDLAAVASTVQMVKALRAEAVIVLSACPPRAPEVAEARDALKAYELPIYPGEITDRRAFSRAIASGTAVTEFDKDGKAAGEIRTLWKWLKERTR
jgi:chromosome partitioning protein